jgi:PAS domain S-box-containing protein
VDCSLDCHTIFDPEGVISYQSPSVTHILGWEPGEMIGVDALSYVHEEDLPPISHKLEEVFKKPGATSRMRLRLRCKDGSYRVLESQIRNEIQNPDIAGLLVVSRDVTSEQETHRVLSNREHHMATVVSHQNIVLWAIDSKGLITVSEGKGLAVIGFEPGVLVGSDVFELYAGFPDVLGPLRRALAGEDVDYVIVVPGVNGEVTLDNRLRPQFSETGEVISVNAISFDITEHSRLEQELRRAKTLEAMGMLAGGIAHDFNNVLTAISGFAMAAKKVRGEQRAELLDHVIDSTDRGAALVSQLLSFARKDEVRPELVDFRDLLSSSMPLFRKVAGDQIGVTLQVETSEDCYIEIDRSKIEQVLINLVSNARDALPDGGSVGLSLSQTDDGLIQLDVLDSGVGMDEETLGNVFEPFYSTKVEGVGLGLATSHSVVERAGGSISVESKPGQGTCFRLRFRKVSAPAPLASSDPTTPAGEQPTTGRILLVDDNPHVLKASKLILESYGYQVREASSGKEAYDLFVEHRSEIDMVMTDMTMPGMKGDELAALLRKEDADIPILCVSGFHEPSALLETIDKVTVLHKPYRGDEPVATITRLLAKG